VRLLKAIVSGGAIVIGVFLAEYLRQKTDRRLNTENAARELAILLPHVLKGMSNIGNPEDTSIDSIWWQKRERIITLLNLIVTSQRRKYGKHSRILTEANELDAKLAAIEINYLENGTRISKNLYREISTAELMTAVFKKRKVLDEKIQHYRSLYDPDHR
jgi:hypothetical protein